MRSSSSELVSVYRAPNLHIDNAKMSKVTALRLHLNLQKSDFFIGSFVCKALRFRLHAH